MVSRPLPSFFGSLHATLNHLLVGDRLVVSKYPYGWSWVSVSFHLWPRGDWRIAPRTPEYGDIVIAVPPDRAEDYIKRVVALPGDRIAVVNGQIVLNGEPVPQVGEPPCGYQLLDQAAKVIADSDELALACHVGPDGDALGSMIGFGMAALLFAAPFWVEKPYTEWTEKETNRVLSDSPWARPAAVKLDFSSMPQGGFGGRGAGMGGPGGTGGAGGPGGGMGGPPMGGGPGMGGPGMRGPGGGMGGGMPQMNAVVMWRSALPVRQASRRPLAPARAHSDRRRLRSRAPCSRPPAAVRWRYPSQA